MHYYLAGRNGDFAIRSPLVLGHESSGVITALGPGVATQYPHLRVGMRVAIECGIPCRSLNADGSQRTGKDTCKHCSNSRYNLCKNLRFCSSAKTFPHRDGMLQETINHEAWCLHPYVHSLTPPFPTGLIIVNLESRILCPILKRPWPNPFPSCFTLPVELAYALHRHIHP